MGIAEKTHMFFGSAYVENEIRENNAYVQIAILENPTYATLENICINRDLRKSYIRRPAGSTFFAGI